MSCLYSQRATFGAEAEPLRESVPKKKNQVVHHMVDAEQFQQILRLCFDGELQHHRSNQGGGRVRLTTSGCIASHLLLSLGNRKI